MPADHPTPPDLTGLTCLHDYEARARQLLPAGIWAYLNAGAADGITHRWNDQAFQQIALLPRVLKNAAGGSTALELFGSRYAHPIFIAPTAWHALAHPDAEYATAVAASALQAPFIVSTQSSVSLEDIGQIATGPLWFQLYMQAERAVTLDLVRRAEQAGYRAIVVTVDAPIQGLRNEDQRQGFVLPPGIGSVNLQAYARPPQAEHAVAAGEPLFRHRLVVQMATWDDVAWLTGQTPLPVLLKGILHPQDVAPALAAGAAGLIVSNHGGRVLDTTPAMLDALPGIVAEVAGRVPVLADGGIRRGTDALKALALGARAVLVGRPVLHGLAVAGRTGVAHVLNLLRSELEAAMILTGCTTLADIGPACLSRRSAT